MEQDNNKPFKILSIDGGGIKGLYSSTILERFEEKYDCCISDHFDMLCGTSTGGLIALALSLKVPAKKISEFYMGKGKFIFSQNRFSSFKQLFWGGKYTDKNLKLSLEEIFKDKRIGDSNNLLCIPAFNYTDSTTCVFKYDHIDGDYGRDNKIKYVDIALATSAAPTYFPLCKIEELNKQYIDGGVWANNPTLVGLIEALSHFVGANRNFHSIKVMSVSSLEIKDGNPIRKNKYLSVARWNKDLLNPFSIGQNKFVHNSMSFLQKHSDIDLDYYRIPSMDISRKQENQVGLDSVSDLAIQFIRGQGKTQADLFYREEKVKEFFTTPKTIILNNNNYGK